MGGRFKAITAYSLRLKRETQQRGEVKLYAAVFTCNMGIALTCSSSSLIRSNDAAICSLMFWKHAHAHRYNTVSSSVKLTSLILLYLLHLPVARQC